MSRAEERRKFREAEKGFMNKNKPLSIDLNKAKGMMNHDPNDSWAQVELYRWQHGELPPQEGYKKLSVPEGLRGMAAAIETKNPGNFPSPFNVMSVLRYAAKLIEQKEK